MKKRASGPDPALLEPGSIFAGKYRVERILGKGGMGVVVQATHLELDQPIALKLLLPHVARDPEVVARFSREARAAARIESAHVARVHDVVTTGKQPYLVMEYLEGVDLARLLEHRGPLPVEDAVGFVLQAAEAIAEAHALGIVHRDLKPPNLFLSKRVDGSLMLKVLDFGISKIRAGAGAPDHWTTDATTAMGSPFYMSPEQMRADKDIDGRTDIWALGVILHELLTDRGPWRSDVTHEELAVEIFKGEPTSLSSLREGVPLELEAAVMRCLRKDRNDRFSDIAELARALAPFSDGRSSVPLARIERLARQELEPLPKSIPPANLASPAGEKPGRATRGEWGTTANPVRKARRTVAAAGVAAVFAAGAIGTTAAFLVGPRRAIVTTHAAPGPPAVSPAASAEARTVEAPSSPAALPEIELSSIPAAPASTAARSSPRAALAVHPPPSQLPAPAAPPPPPPAVPVPPPAPPPSSAPPAPPPPRATGTSAFGPRK